MEAKTIAPVPLLNFSLSKNVLFVRKILPKLQNSRLKFLFYAIKLLSINNILCQKFAALLSKHCNFLTPTFVTYDASGRQPAVTTVQRAELSLRS